MIGTIEWTSIALRHTFKSEGSDSHTVYKKLQELIQDQQPPVYIDVLKNSKIVLWFQNADVANKYKKAINQTQQKWTIFGDEMIRKLVAKKDSSWMNSKWIQMEPLPRGTTRKQIANRIAKLGKCKIPEKNIYLGHVDGDPSKKDWARIECPSNEDAVKLVTSISGSTFNGSVTTVLMGKECTSRILLIGNLGADVTQQDVADYILDHGKIKNPPKTINMRQDGKALIVFETEKDADKTMRKLNGSKLKGRKIFSVILRPKKIQFMSSFAGQKLKLKKKSNDKLNSRKSGAEKKLKRKNRKK